MWKQSVLIRIVHSITASESLCHRSTYCVTDIVALGLLLMGDIFVICHQNQKDFRYFALVTTTSMPEAKKETDLVDGDVLLIG